MAYTTLRVNERGVVLYAFHLARFAHAGDDATAAFLEFAAEAERGSFSLRWDGEALIVKELGGSRLFEGMATRLRPTPLPAGQTRVPKPPPEGPYAAVREAQVATLLTDAAGGELLEACVASLLSWDGARLLCAPLDRPRVLSTSEEAVRQAFDSRPTPLSTDSDLPLLLINAVKGTCAPALPGRAEFPSSIRASIDACLEATAGRP